MGVLLPVPSFRSVTSVLNFDQRCYLAMVIEIALWCDCFILTTRNIIDQTI